MRIPVRLFANLLIISQGCGETGIEQNPLRKASEASQYLLMGFYRLIRVHKSPGKLTF